MIYEQGPTNACGKPVSNVTIYRPLMGVTLKTRAIRFAKQQLWVGSNMGAQGLPFAFSTRAIRRLTREIERPFSFA